MIRKFSRRQVLAGASCLSILATPSITRAASPNIVIIGGGFGGAAAAREARMQLPKANVILYSDQEKYWMCPGSNKVLAGLTDISSIEVDFGGLRRAGVDVRIMRVQSIDSNKRLVQTSDGNQQSYDKLILSPGIDFDYSQLSGMTASDAQRIPHAWKAGPQTVLLREQLQAMPDGGLAVMTVPPAPYRCPPAPAERACLIAHYLKTHKPKSKLIILDAKDEFPFQDLFMEAWNELYSDIIEYRSIADDGLVHEVDPTAKTVFTDFDEIQADVLNVIPPQTASRFAIDNGAADNTGWCPVDVRTFASQLLSDVFVIGDAAVVNALPKAGSTAASQARVAVSSVIAELTGNWPPDPTWVASCYSHVAPDYGIRLSATFALEVDHVERKTTDFSTLGASVSQRKADALFAEKWLSEIRKEIWG